MLNRRYIRVKVFQALYSYFQSDKKELEKIEKDMFSSTEKIYDLYLYIIALLVEIRFLAEKNLESAKDKRLPTAEDLNPNRRFVENTILVALQHNKTFQKFCQNRKISWTLHEDLTKKLLKKIKESNDYEFYMNNPEHSFEQDKELVVKIISKIIESDESLEYHLEEKSIYWIEDFPMVLSNLIKSIKSIKQNQLSSDAEMLISLYKDEEDDKEFAKKLYRKTITESQDLESKIKDALKNWELERVALLDMILMKMALAEMIHFSNIPVKVSLNEYIELSKYYSTPKSKVFINGILDKISAKLKDEGVIVKKGRGLME
jgi:transcription antitermination protein NusB